jgi:GNAT superfamily N-acetyltransferase
MTASYSIKTARDESEVRRCFPAYKELRPHLKSAEELVERWKVQTGEGFLMIYVAEADLVVAAAGYRFLNTTAWGHIMYIDDLVALSTHYKKGLGTALLKYMQNVAREQGCDAVHLDTGYHRHFAHQSYLRNGFIMTCHHMEWKPKR